MQVILLWGICCGVKFQIPSLKFQKYHKRKLLRAPLFSYGRAYKNSPVDYFSEGASWRFG
jgi:hypothetical protein